MKRVFFMSVVDGMIRGTVVWTTSVLVFYEGIMNHLWKFFVFATVGIIISCISMCYTFYVSKNKFLIDWCISFISCIISYCILLYIILPVSELIPAREIGPGEGLLILLYLNVFACITIILRILLLCVYFVKLYRNRKIHIKL